MLSSSTKKRIEGIREFLEYLKTPEGRLEELQELSSYHRLLMHVPHDKRGFLPLAYGYCGYWWHLGGDPKKIDYIQLIRRYDHLHIEFCEPVEKSVLKPALKGRLGPVEISNSKIVDDEIYLTVNGLMSPKYSYWPYKEVDNLELVVVNNP